MGSPLHPQPCPHLSNHRKNHGLKPYNSLKTTIKPTPNARTAFRTPIPTCTSCSRNHGRSYLCLVCSKVSCSEHSVSHSRSVIGHDIAVDVDILELFCCSCQDQVYDPDFDAIVIGKKQIREAPGRRETRGSKKRRKEEVGRDLGFAEDVKGGSFPWGLRGLNNLGNTCFMNSVLQVLLHTPPLRNYFLSDGHCREVCRRKRGRRGSDVVLPCLACDVDGVFGAVFSGDRMPYSPARFLYSWWQNAANLATYEQQDAHEFFISVLDRIHEKEKPALQQKGVGDCHCIVHSIFSGILRSDVTCTVCGFTSTTYDPCVDLSLDLEPCTSTKKSSGVTTSTLTGSLDHFTRPEKLGSDQKLHCQHCDIRQDSLKQMSIRKLPLVLCFHIKRFEHSLRKMPRKIDQYLQFPFSLDMTPYLSSSILRNRFGNRIFAFEGDEFDMSGEFSSEFEVFAVVTHTGGLESGHYVTYLRLRNQWYKCDDAWVTRVNEGVVRASQGYMVYYVQKMIYYKASEDTPCLPLSPMDLNSSARELYFSAKSC